MPSKRVDANSLFDESGNLITSATPLMRKEAKVARKNQDRKKAKSDAKKKNKAGKESRSSLKSKTNPAKKPAAKPGVGGRSGQTERSIASSITPDRSTIQTHSETAPRSILVNCMAL
jgi:hypothetical protein